MLESKYGVLGTIMTWWPLGGAGLGVWLIPCDLSCDLIGDIHRSHGRSHGISHALSNGGRTPLDGTRVV